LGVPFLLIKVYSMTKKVQVLLVEDEFIIADYVQACLTNLGYEVMATFTNYEDTITLLQKTKPDIAIIDISIKGEKTGIDIGKYIGAQVDIPFIFATSHSDRNTIDKATQTEPYAYLIKPFTEEDLYAVIETALMRFGRKKAQLETNNEMVLINDGIFIKYKSKFIKVLLEELLYIEANDNYVTLYTTTANYVLKTSLINLLHTLPDFFWRIQKSYIINLKHLKSFDMEEVVVADKTLPIGRSFYDGFMEKLKIVKG
jgi:two-component system, LytTR family, response regulator LytT